MQAQEGRTPFKITAQDSVNLVDKLSDTFATWASIIDEIEDTNIKAQMDAVYREMIKHTIIMEMDLQWAEGIVNMIIDSEHVHPAIKKHVKAFKTEYDGKYVPQEIQ